MNAPDEINMDQLAEIAAGDAQSNFNFAYLDERTKRMIRRSLLKAVAIPGYQVPFGSREMPLPYGWGTGGIQVTAAVIGPDDVLKIIDQGSDDTVNAVNIKIMTLETRTPPLLWHCHLKRWHSRFVTRAIPQDALGQSAFRGPSTIRCCRGARSAEMCTV